MTDPQNDAVTSTAFESKLVPVLREGIDIIKIVFFKEFKMYLGGKYPGLSDEDGGKLCGAVINDLFGTPNEEISFAAFVSENQTVIQAEIASIPENFEKLCMPLTDALRVQFLCDDLEGIDGKSILEKAKDHGILISDRDIPLPKTFLNLARKLGVAHKILAPETEAD
jgi:hypothetical protein